MGCRASKSALCREYGVSRPTGNKWITRYQAGQQLEDRRRRPIQSPGKTPAWVEALIIEYRKMHPAIDAKKIRRIL